MRRPVPLYAVALIATLAAGADARGQNFFGGGAAFDPEIDVVESGALLDASATVSADRKYVTLTARPQLSTLIALRQFTFQGGGGPVGFGNGQPNVGSGAGGNNAPAANAAPRGGGGRGAAAAGRNGPLLPALARPAEPKPAAPVLHREGMVRIDQPAAGTPVPASPARSAGRP